MRGAKVKSSEIERWITSTSPRPNPLFSLRLFGWKNTKADVAASIALLVLIVASRIAAFPASIWEQDEAYFGCGVVQFDPTSNQPHPPWFPFWMALGKIISPVVAEPTRGLQIASACASVSIVFPLVSLWCIWLRRELAVAAAVLYLFNPAAWVLSGRAFSEPMATMLIVLALALWFDRVPSVSKNLVGSVAGGFCLLTRAHFLIPLAPALLYQVVRSRTRRQRLAVAAPLMVLVAVGYGAVLIDAGGAWHLIEALNNHGNYHFGELAKADLTFDESGIARAFLIPWAGLAWIALAILGAGVAWARGPDFAGFRPFMLLVVLPFVFLVYGISWAGNVRYALPLLALGWGLAMVGLARMAGRWSLPLAALFLISLAGPIAQELKAYRTIASPPMRALEHSLAVARRSGAVIVADRTLASFFDYEQLRHPIPGTVLHDSQIGIDAPPPPEWLTVAIFDNSSDRFVGRTGRTRTFDCQQRWLRRLSQGRFLDITVAEEARVLPIDSRNTALK